MGDRTDHSPGLALHKRGKTTVVKIPVSERQGCYCSVLEELGITNLHVMQPVRTLGLQTRALGRLTFGRAGMSWAQVELGDLYAVWGIISVCFSHKRYG